MYGLALAIKVKFYCVSENKALYKHFGYVKQQIIETLFYTALQRNHTLEY